MKHRPLFFWALLAGLGVLAGCGSGGGGYSLHERAFELEGITEIALAYDEEPITVYEGDGEQLVVREYMTEDNSHYYGKVTQSGRSIRISEGSRPLTGGFDRYVEVWLPASYRENLSLSTTSGPIDCEGLTLRANTLRLESTSGTVRLGEAAGESISLRTTSGSLALGRLQAGRIQVRTTSGAVTCQCLSGRVEYTTTSGDLVIKSAQGSGEFRSEQSGMLDVTYAQVTGDLSLYNKNDDISLTIPACLSFTFEAASKNGEVTTTFQDHLTAEGIALRGEVGLAPLVSIRVEAKNGSIRVAQSYTEA